MNWGICKVKRQYDTEYLVPNISRHYAVSNCSKPNTQSCRAISQQNGHCKNIRTHKLWIAKQYSIHNGGGKRKEKEKKKLQDQSIRTDKHEIR